MTSTGPNTVAVIDDDADVRDVLEAYLELAGHTVKTFRSGSEFLALVTPGRFDCLIVDQMMPEMTGLQVVHELDCRGMAIPTVLITGNRASISLKTTHGSPVIGVLQKPMGCQELLQYVSIVG